jgi:acetyl esterase/lipase
MAELVVVETGKPSSRLNAAVGWLARAGKLADEDPLVAYHRLTRLRVLKGVPSPPPRIRSDYEPIWRKFAGLKVLTLEPKAYAPARDIIYLHGGGYIAPMIFGHWFLLADLANSLQARLHLVRYPLAPDSTADKTVPAVTQMYRELIHHLEDHGQLNRLNNNPVVLAGDSAGGGLAVVVAGELKGTAIHQPDHLVLFSPWVDLTDSNPEFDAFGKNDPFVWRTACEYAAEEYRGAWELNDPRVSPIFGDPTGLPALTMVVGTRESFFPEVRDFARLAAKKNVDTALFIAVGGFHVFPIVSVVPEAAQAMRFISDRVWGEPKPGTGSAPYGLSRFVDIETVYENEKRYLSDEFDEETEIVAVGSEDDNH